MSIIACESTAAVCLQGTFPSPVVSVLFSFLMVMSFTCSALQWSKIWGFLSCPHGRSFCGCPVLDLIIALNCRRHRPYTKNGCFALRFLKVWVFHYLFCFWGEWWGVVEGTLHQESYSFIRVLNIKFRSVCVCGCDLWCFFLSGQGPITPANFEHHPICLSYQTSPSTPPPPRPPPQLFLMWRCFWSLSLLWTEMS